MQTDRLLGRVAVLSRRQRGLNEIRFRVRDHLRSGSLFQLLMLATNMIRKDLNSQNQYDAGVALSGLSCFISADLSRDLANDIMTLVSLVHLLSIRAGLIAYSTFR